MDIVDACQKIGRYVHGKTFDEFGSDEMLFDATVRNLQNIGEAVACLPEDTRSLRQDVEWTRIVGLRHLLVHRYFGVDDEIVWDLATKRCPELLEVAQAMLQALPAE